MKLFITKLFCNLRKSTVARVAESLLKVDFTVNAVADNLALADIDSDVMDLLPAMTAFAFRRGKWKKKAFGSLN